MPDVTGHHLIKMLVKLVTGVSLRKMFNACYEYLALTKGNDLGNVMHSLVKQIQEMQQELTKMRTFLNKSQTESC
jgi:prefoldin subunit 5